MKTFYDEDADLEHLQGETVAVLGYGIQGRAQALNLRDSGISVTVGNRDDSFRKQAREDGFEVLELEEAVRRASIVLMLLPDEAQPAIFSREVAPALSAGDAVVFAHGFVLRYDLVDIPRGVDVLLLAPRMPGQFLRGRFLDGWGVPAFVSVERDASGRALKRLLALAKALGITRCAALEVSAAMETELDHFSEHFTYPIFFRILEAAFEVLVDAGYPPEAALMELHGSGEIGQVMTAAAEEGLFNMIDSHASPACQVGISHYWDRSPDTQPELRHKIEGVLENIRNGSFARHLLKQQEDGYPELRDWHRRRSSALVQSEERLRKLLRGPRQGES